MILTGERWSSHVHISIATTSVLLIISDQLIGMPKTHIFALLAFLAFMDPVNAMSGPVDTRLYARN